MLIRLGQQMVLFMALVAMILGTVLPLVIGGIVAFSGFSGDPAGFFRSLLLDHPFLIAYAFFAFLIVATTLMLLYAFFQAGMVGAYEEAIRLRMVTNLADRFIHFARQSWWQIFWVFQWIWGLIGLIFVLPILAITLAVLIWRDSMTFVVAGCLSLGLLFLIMLVVSFFASGWSAVSVILGVARKLPARQAVADGWRLFRSRMGPIMLVMVLMAAISIVVSGAVVGFSFGVGAASSSRYASLMLFPLQIAVSILQMGVSIFVSCWFTAAMIRVTKVALSS